MTVKTNYGKRLLPQILDEIASAEPDRILYSIPKSSDISHGFRDLSARTIARAIDKTAWLLRGQIRENPKIQSVGYIGPHDLRHILLTYACVKINCTALFLSPKNSSEGALAVLEAANCNIWVHPGGKQSLLVNEFLQKRPMEVIALPDLNELLDVEGVVPYPYTKTWEEAEQDPFCLLHTSGSTGLPKPIVWSHGLIGTMDAVRLLPPTDGDGGMIPWSSGWDDGDRIYSSFSMSHGAGIIMNILIPCLFRLQCLMGPPAVIPNLHLIDSLAEHANIDIWSMIPSLVDELGDASDILPKLRPSKFICASGGPVSPISASKVNDFVRVLNLTGTTEGLFIGNLWVDREDWFYFAFHPFSGFHFKEVEPGIYEHWVHRNDNHAPLFQGIYYTFPDERNINLKDLYVKHPTKPNLWAYHGRNDDIVVMSNGYKINPLDTEALVTTHPAIAGCLMIGSGKSQAGLLIELKDPEAQRSDELLDSIWATVQRANAVSLHKNQLLQDYIGFSESDKPFIRTDKRTIKRRATLALYAEYIENFYDSRSLDEDEDLQFLTIDTSSLESTTRAVRHILGSLLPVARDAHPDSNLFVLGLDSLLLFRAIKAIRVATGLKERLTTRHLYANPTLIQFSTMVVKLASEARKAETASMSNGATDTALDPVAVKVRQMIALHQSRQSVKVNPCDMMNPNIYVGMKFYIPLESGVSFEQAYGRLQAGLQRTLALIPELDGKVMRCSEEEIGYKKGNLRITMQPIPLTATSNGNTDGPLRQLRFKDLSHTLLSYDELRAGGFLSSAFKDEVFTECPWFPPLPADVLYAQANFVTGGCILTFNVHHAAMDGVGTIAALRVWAECCRYEQGDQSATCDWLDPNSLNRDLLAILHEVEGHAKPAHEVDPKVWGFLGLPDPATLSDDEVVGDINVGTRNEDEHGEVRFTNGDHVMGNTGRIEVEPAGPAESAFKTNTNGNPRTTLVTNGSVQPASSLPEVPQFPRKFAWPPVPPADGRQMVSSTFLISSDNVEALKQKVLGEADPAHGMITSGDIVQAFFWRAAIKARYRVARELRGETFGPDETSIMEIPIDARPYFSDLLPSSYMGSCLVTNRPCIGVEELCAPETSLARIAHLCHEAAKHITPSLVHDAFTLLQTVPDYSMITNACMGLSGMHLMMNNLLLFDVSDISFGGEFFANKGAPDTVRIQMDRFNTAFRLLLIHPMRQDGGVELLLGTLPEEFDMLVADEDFSQYAKFMG